MGPFDDLIPAQNRRSAPPMLGQPLTGPPRLPTPRYDDEAARSRNEAAASANAPALAAAQTASAQATAGAAQRQAARGDLTADQMAALRSQYDSLHLLENGINEIDSLYRRDYRGRSTRAFGYLPDAMSGTNQAFNNASNRLMSAIASAQGLTAQQQNTPTELRIRFGPMLPTSTDTDETIEQKLDALRAILNQQRSTLSHQLGIEQQPQQQGGAAIPSPSAPPASPPTGPGVNPNGRPEGFQWGAAPAAADGQIPDAQMNQVYAFMRQHHPGTLNDAALQAEFTRVTGRGLAAGNAHAIADYYNRTGNWDVGQAPPPAPDISASRETPQAQMNAAAENSISQNVPILGQLTQADQALRGPEAANAMLHGGQDWAMFGGRDELAAGMDSLTGGGGFNQNLTRQQAIDDFDSQNHFGDRLGGQLATGLPEAFLPGGIPAQMVRSGAQGTAYGFGSGRGGFNDRAGNAVAAGTIGTIAPPLLGGAGWAARQVARVVAPRLGQAARWATGRARPDVTPEGQTIARAGADENIHVSGPMVDPATRSRMAYLESSLGSGGAVRAPLKATEEGISRRMGEIAGPGAANERGEMGARVQGAARNFVTASGQRIGAVYRRAADLAGGTQVLPGNAVQTLDRHIARLEENAGTNRPLLDYLRTVRGDLVDESGILRPKTVEGFRALRTGLRGEINARELTHTDAERIMGDVLDAGRQDIEYFVGARNPEANRLYQQADREWAGRHTEIRQIVDQLVGRADNPLGGGTVMNKVGGLASGDVPRLRRVWAMLGPEERADLTATIASRAGYKSADEPFSLQQFMVWQRTLPDSARQVIFGADGARSIRNLTILSKSLQETRGQLNNSRSGQVQNWRDTIRSFLGGNWLPLAAGGAGGYGTSSAIGGAAVSAALAGSGMAARRASARSLMNPDLSAWLVSAANVSTPSAMRAHLGRLAAIAARNPAIAQEATGLRQAMLSAVNDNSLMAGRAAASPDQRMNQPNQ